MYVCVYVSMYVLANRILVNMVVTSEQAAHVCVYVCMYVYMYVLANRILVNMLVTSEQHM